jgi:hypothetical protein
MMVELLTITILTLSFHDSVQSGKTIELKTLIYILMLHSITRIVFYLTKFKYNKLVHMYFVYYE